MNDWLGGLKRQLELGNWVLALDRVAEALARDLTAEERFHALKLLGYLVPRLGQHPQLSEIALRLPEGDRGRLRQVQGDCANRSVPSMGRAPVLLFDQLSQEGFIVDLIADFAGDDEPRFCHDAKDALRRAERAVLRILMRRLPVVTPRRLHFRLDLPVDVDITVEGRSLGLAAAVAAYSCYTEVVVPPGVYFSGAVDEDGSILGVSRRKEKLACVIRERADFQSIWVAPSDAGPSEDARFSAVENFATLLERVFEQSIDRELHPGLFDVQKTLARGVELYEKDGHYAAAVEALSALTEAIGELRRRTENPALHAAEAFVALWREASSLVHLGDLEAAGHRFAAAKRLDEELWATAVLSPEHHFGLANNYAVFLRDRLRFSEAEALLRQTLAEQMELRQDLRQIARSQGNLGELLTFSGAFDEAECLLLAALEALERAYPDEVPRELCYLGNLALRRGDAAGALAFFDRGLELNSAVQHGKAANAAFLSYGRVRALHALKRLDEAVEHADQILRHLENESPYPRQAILRYRGLALLARGFDAGVDVLAEAADPRAARGKLMRFVVAKADADLAKHYLAADPPELVALADALERFIDAGQGAFGAAADGLFGRLRLLGQKPVETRVEFSAALNEAVELLPY